MASPGQRLHDLHLCISQVPAGKDVSAEVVELDSKLFFELLGAVEGRDCLYSSVALALPKSLRLDWLGIIGIDKKIL